MAGAIADWSCCCRTVTKGQGPEHSSARLERFLQLCGRRRYAGLLPVDAGAVFPLVAPQMKRGFRKPLVLMTPKSLLRHKACVSPVSTLVRGHFEELLRRCGGGPGSCNGGCCCARARCITICWRKRTEKPGQGRGHPSSRADVSVSDAAGGAGRLAHYRKAKEWIWVQEESLNMGAWAFVDPAAALP